MGDLYANADESLNNSLRKLLKTRGAFANDDSSIKILYLAINSELMDIAFRTNGGQASLDGNNRDNFPFSQIILQISSSVDVVMSTELLPRRLKPVLYYGSTMFQLKSRQLEVLPA